MKRPQGFDRPATTAPEPEPRPGKRRTPPAAPTSDETAPKAGAAKARTQKARAQKARAPKVAAARSVTPDVTPDVTTKVAAAKRPGRELAKIARARRRYERNEVRRFTRRTRHRRAAWLTAGSLVLVLAALVAVAVYSPLLALRTITIDGASRVKASEVHAAIDGQLGTPLALVDYGAITRELSAFPLIRSFVTETVPPDTLVIHIVERAPVGALVSSSGYDVVDPAGVVIQSAAERPAGIPLIDIGGASADSPAFKAVVEVLLALPDSMLAKVESATAQTKDDVTFVLAGVGQRVVWGSAERSALKARVLQELIATQDPAHRVEYDVTAPLSPVLRPVG
jgi:cell division protein FtsQ